MDEYTSLADFAGKKVGFQSGTVQEQNVLTQLPDSEPVTFDIIQNAVLALDSGKVDAVSVSIANGEMFVSTNPKLAVSTVQFDNSQNGNVIGFPKGETEQVDAVNKIIDEVLEQGLYDQWLEEATARPKIWACKIRPCREGNYIAFIYRKYRPDFAALRRRIRTGPLEYTVAILCVRVFWYFSGYSGGAG